MKSALEQVESQREEGMLSLRMQWFFKKYAPADGREAAEFHSDFVMVVQAVHRDASRETHALLMRALAAMPNPFTLIEKKTG